MVEACLSLLHLRAEWATHLRALRTSHCSSFSLHCVGSLVVRSQEWMSDTLLLLTSYCVSHKIVTLLAWLASCHSGIPFPPPLALPTYWNTARNWLQSRTMDSFPRQTPGVLLWLDCSWVRSNRQDHTRFLTPSITHHRTALFCHTRHSHISLPAKLRMSNRKTSEVQGIVKMLFLIFENYRKYIFLQLLNSYVAPWT